MAATKYDFVKSSISSVGLTLEIQASAIVTALLRIDTVDTTVSIWFKDALSSGDQTILAALVAAHTGSFRPTETPTDDEGAIIFRQKAAAAGWTLQLHSIEFQTSELDGLYNKTVNINTGAESDLGFATQKLYDVAGNEIVTGLGETLCVQTRIDWCTNFDIAVRAASLSQIAQPASDIRCWVAIAPGIANKKLADGGMNLRSFGAGQFINVEGVASKFLSASSPVPGINKFRLILKHPPGFKHIVQFHVVMYVA